MGDECVCVYVRMCSSLHVCIYMSVYTCSSDSGLVRLRIPYLLDYYTPPLFASQFGKKEGGAFN